ncbi:MAG: hypothetical protein N838_29490 [Thiohalocapsa sp. PB-PSB1]|nr:MAG: hypothetical protein N838_29490 [Thiohalocapsa sp. PB-PSB1]
MDLYPVFYQAMARFVPGRWDYLFLLAVPVAIVLVRRMVAIVARWTGFGVHRCINRF